MNMNHLLMPFPISSCHYKTSVIKAKYQYFKIKWPSVFAFSYTSLAQSIDHLAAMIGHMFCFRVFFLFWTVLRVNCMLISLTIYKRTDRGLQYL